MAFGPSLCIHSLPMSRSWSCAERAVRDRQLPNPDRLIAPASRASLGCYRGADLWLTAVLPLEFPQPMKPSVFISYAQEDAAWARWIAWELEQTGFRTTYQHRDFQPGSNFVVEMQQAAERSSRIVAVLSPAYLSSQFTLPEWASFFARDPQGLERRLVPVRVRPCSPSGLLASIVHIDLVDVAEEKARLLLRDGFHSRHSRADSQPPYPGKPAASGPKPSFPGGHALLGNLPHLRNRNFTGRTELLEALRTKLMHGRPAVLTQAISGLGGVGKTELAVEYAYQNASDYELVWWVRAEEPALLATDFAGLAEYLDLSEKDVLDQREAITAARRWFESHDRWLLVFDNAEELGDLLPYLPRTGSGNVLITSRNPIWRGPADAFAVPQFDRIESLDFMVKMVGHAEVRDLETLADSLGHLPLALDQAASYIQAADIDVTEYLSLFERYRLDLLKRWFPTTNYPATVATTWEISLTKVRAINPASADLLNILAFLGAESIPKTLLTVEGSGTPEILKRVPLDPLSLNDALLALQRYSLLTRQSGGGYSIHRLVQAVIRDRLSIEDRALWLRAAAWLVDSRFHFDHDDLETWEICRALLSHALNLLSLRETDFADPALGHLAWQVGLYLAEHAEYVEARTKLEEALTIQEKLYSPEAPRTGSLLSDLGLVVQALGDSRAAHEIFERALAIQLAHNGVRHRIVASTENNLGLVEHAIGRFDAARDRFASVLSVLRDEFGNLHRSVAVALNNLGIAVHSLGDRHSARSYLEEAAKIAQATFPPRHPTIAIIESNLGLLFLELGKARTARKYFKIALKIDRDAYGLNHPSHANRLVNQAIASQLLGRHAEALALMEDAITANRTAYANDHPRLAFDLNNLALLLLEVGKPDEARSLLEQALATMRKSHGDAHPVTAVILINLGNVFDILDDLETAQRLLKRAVEICEQTYGTEHAMVARALSDLGCVWVSLGDEESARDCFNRALRMVGDGNLSLLERTTILNNLGTTCEVLGEFSVARMHLTRAASLEQRLLGKNHPRMATTRNNLARVLETLGEIDLARDNLIQALLSDETFYGADHPRIILRLNNLAALLHGMGNMREAADHSERALLICEAHLDRRDPIFKIALENSANILTELGERDLAKTYRLRAGKYDSENIPKFVAERARNQVVPLLAGMAAGGEISQRVAAGNMVGLLLTERKLSTNAEGSLRTITSFDDADKRLILNIKLGTNSDEAFRLLYRRHASRVRAFFERRGLSAESDDLTQEVFIRVARGIESFAGRGRFRAWLFEITTNIYAKELRRRSAEKRSGQEFELDEVVDFLSAPEPSPEEILLNAERTKLLRAALEALPLQIGQALKLRVIDGLSYREAATRLEISTDSLKARLFTGRLLVMERLEDRGLLFRKRTSIFPQGLQR